MIEIMLYFRHMFKKVYDDVIFNDTVDFYLF